MLAIINPKTMPMENVLRGEWAFRTLRSKSTNAITSSWKIQFQVNSKNQMKGIPSKNIKPKNPGIPHK
jgi:hypothetical protein